MLHLVSVGNQKAILSLPPLYQTPAVYSTVSFPLLENSRAKNKVTHQAGIEHGSFHVHGVSQNQGHSISMNPSHEVAICTRHRGGRRNHQERWLNFVPSRIDAPLSA
jgi:hypothetical protein